MGDGEDTRSRTESIYLMGSPGAQHSVAPIVAALIEDIVDESRRQAADSATRRLESALLLMLDECANIAPLGDLPKLVAELGGLGITTAVILQSVASARNVWGEAGERALRDLANITLVWGGQKDISFLTEISRLAGEHDEQVETTTYGHEWKGQFVDGTAHSGAAHRGHRQPSTASRGSRVLTPQTPYRPPASVAWRSKACSHCERRSTTAEHCPMDDEATDSGPWASSPIGLRVWRPS